MAVMQMTSRFMRTDQLFYVQGSGSEIVLSTECWSLNGPAQMRSLMPAEYLCRNNVGTQSQPWSLMKIKRSYWSLNSLQSYFSVMYFDMSR